MQFKKAVVCLIATVLPENSLKLASLFLPPPQPGVLTSPIAQNGSENTD